MRRTKILRAARFSRTGLDELMANVRKGSSLQQLAQLISEFERHSTALVATSREIDSSESNPAGDCRCIFLLQSPNLNAVSATAFSGQVLASPSFLVASVKL